MWINSGLENGLSAVWHKTNTWTNVDLLSRGPLKQTSVKCETKRKKKFRSRKCAAKCRLQNGGHVCSGLNVLSHYGIDEMAASLQTTFSNTSSSMKLSEFCIRLHLNLFPGDPALIEIKAWRQQATYYYLNQCPMLFTNAYIRHSASMSFIVSSIN